MRKKLWISTVFLLFSLCVSRAQEVSYYGFEAAQQTYGELSGATVLPGMPEEGTALLSYYFGSGAAVAWNLDEDASVSDAIPIGFDFTYHGVVFDKFLPMGVGYIVLGEKGTDEMTLASTSAYNLRGFLDNAIGLSADMNVYSGGADATSISYLLQGEEGERTLTVQYKGFAYDDNQGTRTDQVNYQIVLSEGSNSIKMVFGDMVSTSSNTWFKIGIKGTSSDVHFRKPVGDDWGVTNMATNGTSIAGKTFPKGLTYLFTLPEPCSKPEDADPQVTTTARYSNGFEVDLDYPQTNTVADGILVVLSKDAALSSGDGPQDGQTYQKDGLLGENKILYADAFLPQLPGIEAENLDPDSEYFLNIYLYNFICTGGPIYGNGFSYSVNTLAAAPEKLSFSGYGDDFLELSAVSNAKKEEMLVLMTPVLGTDHLGNRILVGDFGYPEGELSVGDTVYTEAGTFGGEVVYVGADSEKIRVEGLQDNTIYHFAAFSLGSDGAYSSLFAQADTVMPAKVPYRAKFETMPAFVIPYSWTSNGEFRVQYDRTSETGSLSLRIEGPDTNDLVTPPIRFPQGKDVRMIFSYGAKIWAGRVSNGLSPQDWTDQDYFVFEASENGKDFVPFYTINKDNADDFRVQESVDRTFSIKGYYGKDVWIRMRFVSRFSGMVDMEITRLELIEVPDCDYPARVWAVDSTVLADEAGITWESGLSDEKVWQVSYGQVDAEGEVSQWSDAVEVRTNPYRLEGLSYGKPYKARVRAVCGVGSVSDWTVSSPFDAGFGLPLVEDFDNLPLSSSGYRSYPVLNAGWQEAYVSGTVSDTLDMRNAEYSEGNSVFALVEWKGEIPAIPGYVANGSAMFDMSSGFNGMLLLPSLAFETGSPTVLEFSASLLDMAGDAASALGEGAALYVVPSFDKGGTFYLRDTLLALDRDKLLAIGDSSGFRIDLSDLDGSADLAFLCVPASNEASAAERYVSFYLDNIRIYRECEPAAGLEVAELRDTSAVLVWRENPLVEEWIVKLEKDETEEESFFNAPSNRLELSDLERQTSYTAYLAYRCSATDTSEWVSIGFTTGGAECEPPVSLSIDDIRRNSALLLWKGDALSYTLRIRPAGKDGSEWYAYPVSDTLYLMDNLLAGTEYEWGVQSRCGEALTDTSAFVRGENFTTTATTCYPPEGLEVVSVTYGSVKLSWEEVADYYQVAYRLTGTGSFTLSSVVEGQEAEIGGLLPESSYEFRVRSICAAEDTSAWSDVVSARTLAIPACPEPTGLKSESVTENSALLKWETEERLSCILRYRQSAATVWDSVKNLTVNEYSLENLEPNTAYIWAVMSLCTENRASGWASAANFTTEEEVLNEEGITAGFRVYASDGQLHLLNPGNVYIERIELFDRVGKMQQTYPIRSNGNVLVRTELEKCPVLVRIVLEKGKSLTYKVFLP